MVPYSLQQNFVVERCNQMVVGMTHSLLKSKGLPGWLWGEVVVTTVYLLNNSLTKGVKGKTPFEGWYGKKSGIQHLQTFECVVHVRDTTPVVEGGDGSSVASMPGGSMVGLLELHSRSPSPA
jgi:hypothetical protein